MTGRRPRVILKKWLKEERLKWRVRLRCSDEEVNDDDDDEDSGPRLRLCPPISQVSRL